MFKKILLLPLCLLLLLVLGAGCIDVSGQSSANKTVGAGGMFVTGDQGETWQAASSLLTAEGIKSISGVSVYRIVDDPQDPNTMYLATTADGMFFTYNNGKTWSRPVSGPFLSGYVYSIAVHPKVKCTLYATNGAQVYRSDDCARSWTEMYKESRTNTRVVSIAFNQFSPYQVFIGETNGDVLESTDSGNSWKVIKRFKFRLVNIIASPLEEGLMYITTQKNGLWRSENNGEDWKDLSSNFSKYSGSKEYRRFLMHPNQANTIYWISTYGILRSNDKGGTWEAMELITPPGSANIYGFAINPNNDNEIFYTATIGTKSTFYKSYDDGKNWITKKLPSGQIPNVLRVHPKNGKMIFLGYNIPPKK